jgi:site-specific DNA-methyltransferase (adenine-specific)
VTLYLGDFREVDAPDPIATITDPPYGETNLKWDRWIQDWPQLIPGRVLWCFGSMRMFMERADDFRGWKFAQDVVWEKHTGSSLAADRFRRVHEHAAQFYKGNWRDVPHNVPRVPRRGANKGQVHDRGDGKGPHLGRTIGGRAWTDDGQRLMRSVIYAQSMHQRALHPTQKPESIVTPLVEFSSNPGDLIYDPFTGSGTVLAVAKALGRRAIGVEIDEKYAERAASRLSQEVLDLQPDLPTPADLRGLAPGMTGGLPAEEWVRRIRDEEPAA